jgi:T5SS/PEP-CTERM-associated repeat protein
MANFAWKGGSGNLSLAANWLNQPNPADPVVPGVNDSVTLGGTGTLTGSISVLSESISGSLTLAGQITAGTTSIAAGTLAVSGKAAKLIDNGYVDISGSTAGALSVAAGASVSQTDATQGIAVGNQTGETGQITVSGSGSKLTDAGYFSVGGFAGSNGTLSVTRAGAN